MGFLYTFYADVNTDCRVIKCHFLYSVTVHPFLHWAETPHAPPAVVTQMMQLHKGAQVYVLLLKMEERYFSPLDSSNRFALDLLLKFSPYP